MKHVFMARITVEREGDDCPDDEGHRVDAALRTAIQDRVLLGFLEEETCATSVTIELPEEHPKEIQAARDNFGSDDIDIDDEAFLSPVDDVGVWVSAWLFVHNEDM